MSKSYCPLANGSCNTECVFYAGGRRSDRPEDGADGCRLVQAACALIRMEEQLDGLTEIEDQLSTIETDVSSILLGMP